VKIIPPDVRANVLSSEGRIRALILKRFQFPSGDLYIQGFLSGVWQVCRLPPFRSLLDLSYSTWPPVLFYFRLVLGSLTMGESWTRFAILYFCLCFVYHQLIFSSFTPIRIDRIRFIVQIVINITNWTASSKAFLPRGGHDISALNVYLNNCDW
jgi:hypothetical protein